MSKFTELAWRKAAASGNNGCVELAALPGGGIAVRDSKDPSGPVLIFTTEGWDAFVGGTKAGKFEL